MKRGILLGCACSALILLNGCGDSHESLAVDAISILKDIADVLSSVKDESSAEAAKPRLKELGGRWRENARRRAAKKSITTKELRKLEHEYGAQLEAAMKRYFAEVVRVKGVEGGEDALRELGEVKPAAHFHKNK